MSMSENRKGFRFCRIVRLHQIIFKQFKVEKFTTISIVIKLKVSSVLTVQRPHHPNSLHNKIPVSAPCFSYPWISVHFVIPLNNIYKVLRTVSLKFYDINYEKHIKTLSNNFFLCSLCFLYKIRRKEKRIKVIFVSSYFLSSIYPH